MIGKTYLELKFITFSIKRTKTLGKWKTSPVKKFTLLFNLIVLNKQIFLTYFMVKHPWRTHIFSPEIWGKNVTGWFKKDSDGYIFSSPAIQRL